MVNNDEVLAPNDGNNVLAVFNDGRSELVVLGGGSNVLVIFDDESNELAVLDGGSNVLVVLDDENNALVVGSFAEVRNDVEEELKRLDDVGGLGKLLGMLDDVSRVDCLLVVVPDNNELVVFTGDADEKRLEV